MPFVAVLTIELRFPGNDSLKGKRKELLSVKAALSRRFGASVAEVDGHDLWQRSTLAAALVARTAGEVERAADEVERHVLARFPDGARVERRVVSLTDLDAWPAPA